MCARVCMCVHTCVCTPSSNFLLVYMQDIAMLTTSSNICHVNMTLHLLICTLVKVFFLLPEGNLICSRDMKRDYLI